MPSSGVNYDAKSISDDGKFVTGGFSLNGARGYVWSQDTGVIQLGSLPGGDEFTGVGFFNGTTDFAVGVSSFGTTATGARLNRVVRWTLDGGLEAIPLPFDSDLTSSSSVINVLSDGRICFRAASGDWLWSESTGFEPLSGTQYMRRISLDGQFMVGTRITPVPGQFPIFNPVFWTPDLGEQLLPMINPDDQGEIIDMSGDGSVIVGTSSGEYLLWFNRQTPVRLIDYIQSNGFDMTDWRIISIFDISADGTTIVGTARNVNWEMGRNEGFVLTIPAPTTASILALGLIATRRKR